MEETAITLVNCSAGAMTMVPTTKWLHSSARVNSSCITNFSIKVDWSILQMIPQTYATRSSRSSKYQSQ